MARTATVKIPFAPFLFVALILAAGKGLGWISITWATIILVAFLPQIIIVAFFAAAFALIALFAFLALIGGVIETLDNGRSYR